MLGADPSPVRCALASVGHPPSTNCEIFRGQRPLATEIWASEKLNGLKTSNFRRLWTKVHQFFLSCRGVIAVSNAVFRSTISCSRPEIFAIKSQNAVVGNYVFGPQNFRGEGPPMSDADILSPMGTHRVGKFGAIPPTDPDDISQSTPDFGQFSNFRR